MIHKESLSSRHMVVTFVTEWRLTCLKLCEQDIQGCQAIKQISSCDAGGKTNADEQLPRLFRVISPYAQLFNRQHMPGIVLKPENRAARSLELT